MTVRLTVNGVTKDVDTPPDTPLLWVLRGELSLSGAKYGCGLDQCGACHVLVDGSPTASCTLPVGDLEGRDVATIESLRGTEDGIAVLMSMLRHNAGQCGYCLPGIVVRLIWLRQRKATSRAEIVRALDPHLCRCGAQPRILRAAFEALGADG